VVHLSIDLAVYILESAKQNLAAEIDINFIIIKGIK